MNLFIGIFIWFISVANSARILGIVPTPAYSHQIVYRPLWKELSLRGHQVVLLTTNPMNNSELTNLTEIDLSENYNVGKVIFTQDIIKKAQNRPFENILKTVESYLAIEFSTMENAHVKKLINDKTEHFDVVLAEVLYRAPMALSKWFNCPLIGILSTDASAYFHNSMGNPSHPILQPEISLYFDNIEMTFIERIISVIANVCVRILIRLVPYMNYKKESMLEQCLPNITLNADELLNEMSLLFLNVNPIFWGIRPVNPNTILFGDGIHIEEPKPLPKDLRSFLHCNPKGVIYFSLGSNVLSNTTDESFNQVVLETIKSLPYKVLWKYESDTMENKPENVKISKWLPQQDVLRHPNIKLFITQGGLQSTDEAIHSKVPMVVIPFFGDQQGNAYRVQAKGMGLSLNHQTLTKEEFRNAILEVINNKKYRLAVEEISKFTKDQPMTGLEKLVWWTEYVIRNKGAKYFKNPGANLPLYQYLMLDVIGFFVILVSIIFSIILFIFKQIKKWIGTTIIKNKID